MIDKKHIRKLISKEKAYYSRLNGIYKDKYKSIRNRKCSISENKKKLRGNRLKNKIIYHNIVFPGAVDIYHPNNCRKSIKACNSITENNDHIVLDFSEVKSLSAAVTAYLLSTIHKALSMGRVIKCKYPKEEKSKAVLQKVGLFKLLGRKDPLSAKEVNQYPDVKRWYVYKGENWDGKILYECVHEFTSNHMAELSWDIPDKHKKSIERNIKELIGNIIEHAYPDKYLYDKHWILFATYDNEKDQLILVISDSGKSIPVTYVQYHKDNPSIKDRFEKGLKGDTKLIEMAVRESSSGTGLKGRGYGLRNIERTISNYGGSLVIYSKKGCFVNKDTDALYIPVELKKPINGTVINITLPLESLK